MKKNTILLTFTAIALSSVAIASCATAAATADALGAAAVKSVASNGNGSASASGKDSTAQQMTQTQNVTVNVNQIPYLPPQEAPQNQPQQAQAPQYAQAPQQVQQCPPEPGCIGNEQEITIEYCQEKTGVPCFQGISNGFSMASAKSNSERDANASIATATNDNITNDLDAIRKQLADKGVVLSEKDSLEGMVVATSKAAVNGATIFRQSCFRVHNGSNTNECVFRYITVKRLPAPAPTTSNKSQIGTATEWVSSKIIEELKNKTKKK